MVITDEMVRHMVNRFLGWRLPKPWTPDNGVSYTRPNYAHRPADHDWPIGTNLFSATEAEAMVRYMLEGMPLSSQAPKPASAGGDVLREHEVDEYFSAHSTCPMCGKNYPHTHPPHEVVVYRNGVKYGRQIYSGIAAEADTAKESCGDICKLARSTGVICAEGECDIASDHRRAKAADRLAPIEARGERERWRAIEHHCWHILDDSEDNGESIVINKEASKSDLDALYELLPEDHPAELQPIVDHWAPSGVKYDRAIHHNPDAKAWADMFVATFPGLADKHGLMLGWFANAMMAMHDHLRARESAPAVEKTPNSA